MDLPSQGHLQQDHRRQGQVIEGVGLGLRPRHQAEILAGDHDIGWFEALSDNYLDTSGPPMRQLEQVRARYPIVLHGVGLSIGSVDPLDHDYLDRLARLAAAVQPEWVSDHLCFTHAGGRYSHDLLPLPYTPEALRHCVQRISVVQERLGRRLVLENVSSYLRYADSCMSEWEFLAAVADEADCEILLDVNNVAVSAHNHGFDPGDYLAAIPPERVRQMHLAGYEQAEDHRLDTHGRAVQPDVWSLYEAALARFGPVPTSLEWDQDIPDFETLCTEAARAQERMDAAR